MSKDSERKWLTTNIIMMGLISFFADVSGEMMTPVLPLFIAALGGSSLVVGFIGGFGDAVANIVKVFSGYIADKTGRRKLLITIGYGIPFFAKLGIGVSNTWEQVLILKPTERLGKGIRGAPRDSLVADSVEEEYRGRAFGFHRMMDTAGAIFGSFLALIIVIAFSSTLTTEQTILQVVIIVSAFISLLAVIPIAFLTDARETLENVSVRTRNFVENLKQLPKGFYKFLIVSSIFGLSNFTILLFILHVRLVIGLDSTASALDLVVFPILVFIWFNIIYTVLSIPFGTWSDKYGRKPIFALGIALFAIVCIGFTLTENIWMFFALFGLYGAFNAANDGIQKAYAVDLLPNELKGTGIGLLQTLIGLASVLGGILAGALYDLNFIWMFIYGAGVAIIALILFLWLKIPLKHE